VVLGTFHGFCARVLRVDGRPVGLLPGFTIYDRDDQLSVVKDICRELSVDVQNLQPRALLAAISRWKNDGIPTGEALAGDGTPFERVAGNVYGKYVEALAAANAADFDDLLLLVTRLFRERPDVLERYRRRFEHVLVDEYQDTNLVQYRLARDIAAGSGNLCATGDPDQSIYKWRGARIRNILEFTRDFPGAHVVRLEQNYRSTGHILAAASAVIANNPGRLMGPLWSELGDGCKVELLAAEDEESEADQVVRRALRLHAQGLRLREMAVFYRTNALSRGLERALRLHNVPYDIVGAVEFYERKEVKDLLAWLRVLVNPADAVSFLRIVNVPARGLGKASLERLRAWAVPQGLSPREAARRAGAGEVPEIPGKARTAFAQLSQMLDELAATLAGPVEDTFRAVVRRIGYLEYLRDFGGQEASDRIENVGELEGALAAYARAAPEPSVAGFLQETALLSDADAYDPNADRLTLMTLHAAKGLEFPAVFMVGLEEGQLPHARALDVEEDLQEERRLCYVGLTRAQRHLTLSWAARRATFGAWATTRPSRFLDEIPPQHVERDERPLRAARAGPYAALQRERPDMVEERSYVPDPEDYLDVDAGLRLPRQGATVRHAHFGQGVVLKVVGAGGKARITVRFERFGDKQLMAEYARLEEVF
jgi:DNA helicase-2/ATP-dependent DNA helicase PcrA